MFYFYFYQTNSPFLCKFIFLSEKSDHTMLTSCSHFVKNERNLLVQTEKNGSIIYGTDESELILQPHFHFRY
ncbi:hypothetical protein EXW04_14630 [Enterococcus faecium]|nr:hypothetical protein [Enterococcus faecium]